MANVAEQAIERSKSHDETVTIDFDAAAAATLSAKSDDSVSANGVTEYWANDPESETAMLWRVHMRDAKPEVTDRQIKALRDEAFAAGDALQGYICRVALGAEYTEAELNDDSCLDARERRIVANLSQDEARAKCAAALVTA